MMLLLNACAREESADLSRDAHDNLTVNPSYENEYGDYGYYGSDTGSNLGMTGAAAATAWADTPLDKVEETASWAQMEKHGKYFATADGRVYSYGENPDLWAQAKDSVKAAGDEMEEAVDDLLHGDFRKDT